MAAAAGERSFLPGEPPAARVLRVGERVEAAERQCWDGLYRCCGV
jgi:hypothetical protein